MRGRRSVRRLRLPYLSVLSAAFPLHILICPVVESCRKHYGIQIQSLLILGRAEE